MNSIDASSRNDHDPETVGMSLEERDRFWDRLERQSRNLLRDAQEKGERRELLDAQIAAEEARRDAAIAAKEESDARIAALHASANNKSEGAHSRARAADQDVITMLAGVGGFMDDDPMEAARALRAQAEKKGIFVECDNRTIAARLTLARKQAAKHAPA